MGQRVRGTSRSPVRFRFNPYSRRSRQRRARTTIQGTTIKNHCVHVIGVDVAKAKLDIYDNQTKRHSVINNTAKEIKRFVQGILQHENQVLVVMEATGGYEYLLRNNLLDADVACSVINPLQIRNFARGCGLKANGGRLPVVHWCARHCTWRRWSQHASTR